MGRDRRQRNEYGGNRGGGDQNRGSAIMEAISHMGSFENLGEWEAGDLVTRAYGIGRELKDKGVTTSQIRNFLDEVNKLEAEARKNRDSFDRTGIAFLDIQLAYAAGREEKLKHFSRFFSTAAKKVHSREDFDRFVKLTQAVVAYHRFHGGSNR